MSLLKVSAPLVQSVRRIGTTQARRAATEPSPKFIKLKAKQEQFGTHDGTLVHVKGGVGDKFLYYTTMGLSLVGVALCVRLFADLSIPKKE